MDGRRASGAAMRVKPTSAPGLMKLEAPRSADEAQGGFFKHGGTRAVRRPSRRVLSVNELGALTGAQHERNPPQLRTTEGALQSEFAWARPRYVWLWSRRSQVPVPSLTLRKPLQNPHPCRGAHSHPRPRAPTGLQSRASAHSENN